MIKLMTPKNIVIVFISSKYGMILSNIVEVGQSANLTWFDPKAEWVYAKSHSRSKNSNLFQKKLIGKVLGIFVKSNFFSNT